MVSTVTEDQQKFIVPLNRETENIFYDKRIIIDNMVLSEARTWKVSKVNRIAPNGVAIITLSQTFFDANKDYIELDDNGNVIGMWADYYTEGLPPKDYDDTPQPTKRIEITFPGKPVLKIGGQYKTFTAEFQDIDAIESCTWQCYIDGVIETNVDIQIIDDNHCKIKFTGDDLNYIGKLITIEAISASGLKATTEVEIRRL